MAIQSCLTVVFDDGFYRAIAEVRDGKRYSVASVVLGSSTPQMPMILELVNRHWSMFHFQHTSTRKSPLTKHINPKRAQRLANRAMKHPGVSTKAQATLHQQLVEKKQRRQERRQHHQKQRQVVRYLKRQQKRREKHRGH